MNSKIPNCVANSNASVATDPTMTPPTRVFSGEYGWPGVAVLLRS